MLIKLKRGIKENQANQPKPTGCWAIPDKVADPTNVSLYNKLMTDPTIGGLAIDIKPSTVNFEIIEADQPAGIISNEFDIEYRSSYNNLST